MSDVSKADLSVRIVDSAAKADQSVFVVNQKVVSGTPTAGQVPVEQADGTLAWGGPYVPVLTPSGGDDLAALQTAAHNLVEVNDSSNCDVHDNALDATNSDSCIEEWNDGLTGAVTGNRFEGNYCSGGAGTSIGIVGTQGTVVHGNRIANAGTNGI